MIYIQGEHKTVDMVCTMVVLCSNALHYPTPSLDLHRVPGVGMLSYFFIARPLTDMCILVSQGSQQCYGAVNKTD